MVRERHGVQQYGAASTIVEQSDGIRLIVGDNVSGKAITLTPDEARYLASKLRRLANKVENNLMVGV